MHIENHIEDKETLYRRRLRRNIIMHVLSGITNPNNFNDA